MSDAPAKKREYRAPALEKGLDVLELLAAHRGGLTLAQISAALDRSSSELFRMVQVLEARGYVGRAADEDGLVLTNKLFALGMTRAPAKDLLEAALPEMRASCQATGQSCHLAVASGDQMVVVARIEAPGDQGYSVRVGYRRKIVEATSGLVLFAFQPERVRERWGGQLRDGATKAAWETFLTAAAQARKDGHVQAASYVTSAVIDLSVPVHGADGVVAALTCPYVDTPSAISMPDTIANLQRHAAAISAEIGPTARNGI
ncbi:IclR family transcriptional regulator [Caulobacter radicis]|uniref:IclR family transcriptional regulator n=1 Tax=Caulobacter radicis TaxID=2172650 RepID=UPI000D56B0C1|nr:IclR family transcriptional regulator [Caulobacter radicis]PVM90513.1 IclR family transcriptional regulator [Caulobacter radicis]